MLGAPLTLEDHCRKSRKRGPAINLDITLSVALKNTYTYDVVDQLTRVAYATRRTVSYAYDSVGNRSAVTDNGVTASYAVNALNQYIQAGSATPSYDRNGNLTSMSGKTFGYDAQNRLVSASNLGGSATLTYDARNRCVSRMINGVTTYLYYDGWDLIEERNASGHVGSQYIHGVATDEMLAKIDSTTALYYHQDGLGNVVALSDAAGSTVERYTYDVFGAPTIRNAANGILTASAYGNRFLYTGREYLRELGLYDYRNRVYSADLGRFLQTDPIRFAGGDVNIYRYVGNSSINFTDANGLVKVCWTRNPGTGGDDDTPPPPTPPHTGGGGNGSGGHTWQFGITIGASGFGLGGALSTGIAFDSNGGIGLYSTYGGGPASGFGAYAGASVAGSNAQTVSDLAGPFWNGSASLGDGVSGSADAFYGPSEHGMVTGGGFTGGVGFGGSASTGMTQTAVQTLR